MTQGTDSASFLSNLLQPYQSPEDTPLGRRRSPEILCHSWKILRGPGHLSSSSSQSVPLQVSLATDAGESPLTQLCMPTFAYTQPQIKETTHDLPAQTAPGTLTGDSIVKDLDSEQRLLLFVSASGL